MLSYSSPRELEQSHREFLTKLEFKMRSAAQASARSFRLCSVILCGLRRSAVGSGLGKDEPFCTRSQAQKEPVSSRLWRWTSPLPWLPSEGCPGSLLGRDCDESVRVWNETGAIFPEAWLLALLQKILSVPPMRDDMNKVRACDGSRL